MRGRGRLNRRAVFALLILMCSGSARAATISVTTAPTLTEGNANIGFPFNTTYFGTTSMRYQQVFDVSSLGTMPASGEIVGIAFRVDGYVGESFDSTLNVQIDLSTVTAGVRRLDSLFSNNVGADNKTVFRGSLHLASTATPDPSTKTMPFDVIIDFSSPFQYKGGNLLLDIRNFSGGKTSQLDGWDGPPGDLTRVYSFNVNYTLGAVRDSSGLLAQFKLRSISAPLPTPSCLMIAPLTWLYGRSRRRSKI
jgi:hypothetical protein